MKAKNFYVYGHFDKAGNAFYIGKGTRDRAYRKEIRARNWYWGIYVDNYLGGEYDVRILDDGLTSEEAEDVEGEKILEYGYETLVNIDAPSCIIMLKDDFSLSINTPETGQNTDILWKHALLSSKNSRLINKSRKLEHIDIGKAIKGYKQAIDAIKGYAYLVDDFDNNEVDTLKKKIKKEFGGPVRHKGEISAIDRLTICLCRSGKIQEAKVEADNYFEQFPDDKIYASYEKIMRRVNKLNQQGN